MQITLYTKPDCGLCQALKADLLSLAQDPALHAVTLHIKEINIQDDAHLHTTLYYLIPVLELPDGELHYPPHDYLAVRSALLRAAQSEIQ